jgi:hypothetical protein
MTIRVDLHVHAKVSKTIPFEMESFSRTVRQAMRVGLNGFALTEHFHSIDFWKAVSQLVDKHPYRNGRLTITPWFHVLTGTELTVSDGADIIVIGTLDNLAKFDRQFRPKLSDGNLPRLADIFEPARDADLVLIGAHPTREGKRLVDVGEELMSKLDALEVNGKDMASGFVHDDILARAKRIKKPVVGSSDAHLWPQVGVQRTLLPLKEVTQEGLREAIRKHKTRPESTKQTRHIVGLCQTHKKIIKASLHARSAGVHGRPVPGYVSRVVRRSVAAAR